MERRAFDTRFTTFKRLLEVGSLAHRDFELLGLRFRDSWDVGIGDSD